MKSNYKKQNFLVGAHSSIAYGFENACKSVVAMGGNSIQIFLKSPRSRSFKPFDEIEAEKCRKYVEENNLFLVGHCSYLLNFAKDPEEDFWAVESLIEDIRRVEKLGGVGVVLHIGKYLNMSCDKAFENIKKSVSYVIENISDSMKVIFENTAGQGTEIGFKFDELRRIYDLFSEKEKKQIGFCLDTCHSFAAGYDLRNEMGVRIWKSEFDSLLGWENVVCIHFNDAKRELNSRVDRHQDIGFGFIGDEGLIEVAKIAKLSRIPLILETTSEHLSYKEQIKKIKNWFV